MCAVGSGQRRGCCECCTPCCALASVDIPCLCCRIEHTQGATHLGAPRCANSPAPCSPSNCCAAIPHSPPARKPHAAAQSGRGKTLIWPDDSSASLLCVPVAAHSVRSGSGHGEVWLKSSDVWDCGTRLAQGAVMYETVATCVKCQVGLSHGAGLCAPVTYTPCAASQGAPIWIGCV